MEASFEVTSNRGNIMKHIELLAAALVAVSATSASATIVTFVPGTYYLAKISGDTPTDILTVTVTGGIANFVIDDADFVTFSVPDNSTPEGVVLSGSPYYASSSLPSTNYSATAYPYLSFYSTAVGGGLTIGTEIGDTGSNRVNLFESNIGTGQVYTLSGVPEPAAWALMLTGFGLLGGALRGRRGSAALST